MKRFQIFYYIELTGEGGQRLVIADTQDKALEIFKTVFSKEGKPEFKITEVRIL